MPGFKISMRVIRDSSDRTAEETIESPLVLDINSSNGSNSIRMTRGDHIIEVDANGLKKAVDFLVSSKDPA